MKKILVILVVISLILMTACGGGTGTGSADADTSTDKQIIFKVATIEPDESITGEIMADFEKYVEENTDGLVDVQIYSNSILGGEREIIEGILLGTIQMGLPSTTVLSTYGEKFSLLEIPFLFPTYESNLAAWDGELGKVYSDWLHEEGFINYGIAGAGFRGLSNSKRTIHTPDDMKGLKIRVMESNAYVRAFELMGANPIAMSYSEIYTGLQQKTIDGQDNPPQFTLLSNFYEVQPYYTRLDHVICNYIYLCSADFMESLDPEVRKVIEDAVAIALPEHREKSMAADQGYLEEMEKKGVEITYLTDEERQLFIDAVKPLHDEYRKIVGDEVFDLALSYSK